MSELCRVQELVRELELHLQEPDAPVELCCLHLHGTVLPQTLENRSAATVRDVSLSMASPVASDSNGGLAMSSYQVNAYGEWSSDGDLQEARYDADLPLADGACSTAPHPLCGEVGREGAGTGEHEGGRGPGIGDEEGGRDEEMAAVWMDARRTPMAELKRESAAWTMHLRLLSLLVLVLLAAGAVPGAPAGSTARVAGSVVGWAAGSAPPAGWGGERGVQEGEEVT